jgi:hypothetical protein
VGENWLEYVGGALELMVEKGFKLVAGGEERDEREEVNITGASPAQPLTPSHVRSANPAISK